MEDHPFALSLDGYCGRIDVYSLSVSRGMMKMKEISHPRLDDVSSEFMRLRKKALACKEKSDVELQVCLLKEKTKTAATIRLEANFLVILKDFERLNTLVNLCLDENRVIK